MCRGDDAWCGYCGAGCALLDLSITPAILHVGYQPPNLWCALTNHSCADLSVEATEHPHWLDLGFHRSIGLPAGESVQVSSPVNYAQIKTPQASQVFVRTHAGTAGCELLWIDEKPKLLCVPEIIEAWAGKDTTANDALIFLRPNAGKLLIRSCRLEGVPGQISPAYAGEAATGILAGAQLFPAAPQQGAPFHLCIDARKLQTGLQHGRLLVEYESPHGPQAVTAEFAAAIRKPPQLRWPGELQRPKVLHQTERQKLSFQLKNQDPSGNEGGSENADLIIQSVQLIPPPGVAVPVSLLTPMPQRVGGGRECEIAFELDLSSVQGQHPGLVEFTLRAESNLRAFERPAPISVAPVERFEGVLAIDFGSSNSCCAVMQPGGTPELLPLDEEFVVSPTVVSYLDLSRIPPSIEIGARIKRLSVEDESVAGSTADRLKQRLGERRQNIVVRARKTQKWGTRKASEAATDYLRSIRQFAEERKDVVFDDFILTHPARCSLRQHQRLRRALMDAFGSRNATISFLQEPIAALIPFMVERGREPAHASYTVASFDLGGGTTDVAVVRVDYQVRSPEQVEIHPTVLHCEGLNFGGEDLTDFLRKELEDRCKSFLGVREPDAMLIAEGVEAAAALDVRRNRDALNDAAERYKASLSEERGVAVPLEIDLRITQADKRTVGYKFEFLALRSAGTGNLEQQFLAYARRRVEEAAAMLENAVKQVGARLDFVELSGKTSYLPVVHETIARLFPGVIIDRAADPKECVVRGACLSRSLRRGSVLLMLTEQSQRMTSSIGVFGPGNPFFFPLLKVDEAVPEEGLERELPDFWDGTEAVVLWEDLNNAHQAIEYSVAATYLDRLGTWIPERTVSMLGDDRWSLRLTLKEFKLEVEAVARSGETVSFRPASGIGE